MEIKIEEYASQAQELVALYGLKILGAIAIFIIGKWIVAKISVLIFKGMEKKGTDPTISHFVKNILYYLMFAFVVVAALGQVGIQTASIVAILGAAGLAVGLALQGSLSNFAAGVLMIIFRPIRVGDFVEAAGAMGSVKEVSIFTTTLLTPDNKTVIIANASVMGSNITNFSMQPKRRVDLLVGVSYSADILKVKEVLTGLVEAEPLLLDDEPTIAVSELAASSVNFVVRVWVKTEDYWTVFFSLNEKVKLELDKQGIEIPFNQMDVNLNYTPEQK